MADFNLEDILPLLISRQKQQAAEDASRALPGAAAGAVGKTLAPNLYDLLTQPRPAPAQPIPNAVGKIPEQDGMDPRMVPALRDVGLLGAGGAIGRAAAPLAGEAAGLAGRVASPSFMAGKAAPSLDSSGALRVLGGEAMLSPPDTAEAAGMRLPYEERVKLQAAKQAQEQQLELEKQRAAQGTAAEAARTQAQTQAGIEADKARAEAQRQLEAQRQQDMAAALKKEREMPFREAHSDWAKALPILGAAGATALPPIAGAIQKIPLNRFVNKWEKAGQVADKALEGRAKMPATLATKKLEDFENKWPAMEKRYTPGLLTKSIAATLPAEGVAFPTEYDFSTQDPNSSGRPTMGDVGDTALRAAGAGLVGTGFTKLGSGFVPKTLPYTGGGGTISAYNTKYPPTKAQQKLIADQLRLQGPK